MYLYEQLVYSNGEPICEGDWVRVFVPQRGVWHHGIVRGVPHVTGGYFALEIAHNRKLTGIVTTDVNLFTDGQPMFLHRRPIPAQVPEILARVDGAIGQPYHLFAQNCEHFASFAFTGKAESPTVKTVG